MDDELKRTIFVDMDGVISDWDIWFKHISGGLPEDEYKTKFGNNSAFELVKSKGINWWATMPWTDDGKKLWTFINDNFLEVKILTASGSPGQASSYAKKGKLIWIQRNLPELIEGDFIIVGPASEKWKYCNPGDILVDDSEKNISDWTRAGGEGVLHRNYYDTISKLKMYI